MRGWKQVLSRAGDIEYRVQQGVADGFKVFGLGALRFVMADAIFAGREEHRRRAALRDIASVMTGAGCNILMRGAKLLTSALYGGDAALVKGDRRGV